MKIKARTEYTKELFVKLARFNAVNPRSKFIWYAVIELFMFGIVAYGFYSATTEGEAFALAVVFAFVFPLICPAVILLLPMLTAKENNALIGGVNIYEFSNDEIIVCSTMQDAAAQTKMNYSSLFGVYETNDMFYLYISKRQTLIMRKSDIFEGSVSDLQNILMENVPDNKYVLRGMKKKVYEKTLDASRDNSIKTVYSMNGDYRYEIFRRKDGIFQIWVQNKLQLTDYLGNDHTVWHDVRDYAHVADTLERAEEIGNEALPK